VAPLIGAAIAGVVYPAIAGEAEERQSEIKSMRSRAASA